MTPASTPTQRLASLLLGRPVQHWIAEQREAGWSWRKIAHDLKVATNGQVDISHEAVRGWAERTAA